MRLLKGRDGVARVYTVESFRDERGRPRQRTIAAHGRLEDLLAEDPDAVDKLKAEASRLTAVKRAGRGQVAYDTTAPSDGAAALNLGWLLVDAVVARLGSAKALAAAGRVRSGDAACLRLITCSRVVWPSSKLACWEHRHTFFAGPDVTLGGVYSSLDRIAETAVGLQQAACAALGRRPEDLVEVDYDVTNYFFHIDAPDPNPAGVGAPRGQASRQYGHSKENRPDPIVQMGLFTDAAGLPICYRLFAGNTTDSQTLPAALAEFKRAFPAGRIVVVADKAMHTAGNLGRLHQHGDGWIVSASARHADRKTHAWLDRPDGWTWNEDHTAKVKSAQVTRKVKITLFGVDGLPATAPEKMVAVWSADAAARDKAVREEILARAETLARDETAYRASNRRGVKKYIRPTHIDKDTGEILDEHDTCLTVDWAQADREARYDGYQMVRTSETGLPDRDILARYRQLWRIEQTFRVSKTGLQTRPVYVRTRAHIEAHFATCFLALLAERLLERWTGLPSPQLLRALKDLQAVPVGDGVYRICRPAAWDLIDQATGVPLNQSWATIEQLRDWRRQLAKTAKTTCFTTPENTPRRTKTPSHTPNPAP